MEKQTPTTEPRFVDDKNSLIEPLPIFVTRTTLRVILNKHGAKISDRGTGSTSSKPGELMSANATMDELLSGPNR
ncbi:hypothetical protein CFN58_03400 [Pseudomonas avellanae]|uniref:Uncharacterized protein n=2 Tax=Pseudomonas syringae group TaxID=136849 RepID=A0A261WN30_9PSED|nr:hypothetical protein CT122_28605 [Pseudomonas syringae pv. actinidiae]OZI87578.1 hypothetical protein CFN58_03400 [Pseudomonas avellanae]PIN59961.1 hypothetical protein CUB86_18865 [Pseudomonas syringae pv. actinidiae]